MNESCALDIADREGTTLEDVGAIMNITRERVRQVEVKAFARLEAAKEAMALREFLPDGPARQQRAHPAEAEEDDLDDEEDDAGDEPGEDEEEDENAA